MEESKGHFAPLSFQQRGTPEAWNERYANEGMIWGRGVNSFLAEFAENLPPGRVLDLGCGQGRNAVWLARQGHQVTGIDFSSCGIADARALAKQAGVEVTFLVDDLSKDWHPDRVFDLVLLSYLQLPPPARRVVHKKAVEALAPGGKLFLIAHHSDNLSEGVGGPPYPEVLFSEADLAADFSDLKVLENQKVFRPVELKDGSIKQAHDIRLLGQKPEHKVPV